MFQQIEKALNSLRNITLHREAQEHLPFDDKPYEFPQITQARQNFGNVKPLETIEDISSETLNRWTLFTDDPNLHRLSPKNLKRICWSPKIVGTKLFIQKLVKKEFSLTISCVKGLLYSYHSLFDDLKVSSEFGEVLSQLISHYSEFNSQIAKWCKQVDCIVGVNSPKNFGIRTCRDKVSVESALKADFLYETTQFAAHAAQQTALAYINQFNKISPEELEFFLNEIISSKLLSRDAFKIAVSEVILTDRCKSEETTQAKIIDFILGSNGLGDPRMHPENWMGVSEEAKKAVIQWLSREDINFFFELLIKDKEDKHKRKNFWLSYVSRVSRSRALLSSHDRSRHAVKLQELENKGRSYGELTGPQDSSAFILDFGQIVVVEFNQVGNACYIYTRHQFDSIVKEFWTSSISFSLLKNQSIVAERVRHTPEKWQDETRGVLARFGIRRN